MVGASALTIFTFLIMDRYITYSRPDALGSDLALPMDKLISATASNDNAMITLVFEDAIYDSNTSAYVDYSMYLNTKPGKAEKALEQLLSDVQHVYSPKMYDVSLAPNYNDVTGPKMFQNGGTLFVPDYTAVTGNTTMIVADDGAGTLSFTIVSDADVTNFSSASFDLQVITDITAECSIADNTDVTSLNGVVDTQGISAELKVALALKYDITDLTLAENDTVTMPAFSVIDVKTGEVLEFPTYTHTVPGA